MGGAFKMEFESKGSGNTKDKGAVVCWQVEPTRGPEVG